MGSVIVLRFTSTPKSSSGVTPRTKRSSSTESKGPFRGAYCGSECRVILGLRPKLARLFVLVNPVQDGIGHIFGHSQGHQQVAGGAVLNLVGQRDQVQIQSPRLVFQAITPHP